MRSIFAFVFAAFAFLSLASQANAFSGESLAATGSAGGYTTSIALRGGVDYYAAVLTPALRNIDGLYITKTFSGTHYQILGGTAVLSLSGNSGTITFDRITDCVSGVCSLLGTQQAITVSNFSNTSLPVHAGFDPLYDIAFDAAVSTGTVTVHLIVR